MGPRNSSKVRKLRSEKLRGGPNRLVNKTLEMRFKADPRTLALPSSHSAGGGGGGQLAWSPGRGQRSYWDSQQSTDVHTPSEPRGQESPALDLSVGLAPLRAERPGAGQWHQLRQDPQSLSRGKHSYQRCDLG